MLELIWCPDCGRPAEVLRRDWIGSTHGPVEHLQVRCLDRHVYFLAAAYVVPAEQPADELAPERGA